MKTLLVCLLWTLWMARPAVAGEPVGISGAVAYTEIMRFDYTKDGIKNRVQFWLEFKGRPAAGKPGAPDVKPEEGAVYYYLYDVDKKEKVSNWLMGFGMLEGPPPSGPYPMSDLVTDGNTARFQAFGMKWTVEDGGEGHAKDRLTVDDGFRQRQMKTYDGDLRVVSVQPTEAPDSRNCLGCHRQAAITMKAKGGKHTTMECVMCHPGHPPEVAKPFVDCTPCHQPHSPQMAAAACTQCHKAHTASVVNYAFNVPSRECASCHPKSAEVLAGSGGKHKHLSCPICHREKHKDVLSCDRCHGAPHPADRMEATGMCGSCHRGAHNLQNARSTR